MDLLPVKAVLAMCIRNGKSVIQCRHTISMSITMYVHLVLTRLSRSRTVCNEIIMVLNTAFYGNTTLR